VLEGRAAPKKIQTIEVARLLGWTYESGLMKKPPFTVVKSDLSDYEPPRPLGIEGRKLWNRFSSRYSFVDEAGAELLAQICEATDEIALLKAEVVANGAVIRTRAGGLKSNPAVQQITSLRGFITRAIHRLGLNSEPIGNPGRPPGPQLTGHDH
jgi:phage terminase small subunit